MFSQDQYRGKFCASTVIDCMSAEATALINYKWLAALFPPPPIVLFSHNRCPTILVSTPQSGLALRYFIQGPYCLFSWRSCSTMGAPQSPPCPRLIAPLLHSTLPTSVPFWCRPAWMGRSGGLALLKPHQHSVAWICTTQFHPVLLHHHQHSPCPPGPPYQALLLSCWRASFSPVFIILPFQLHFNSPCADLTIATFQISHIDPNDIGIQFHPPVWLKLFGTRN